MDGATSGAYILQTLAVKVVGPYRRLTRMVSEGVKKTTQGPCDGPQQGGAGRSVQRPSGTAYGFTT
jgi:hypothetical protein